MHTDAVDITLNPNGFRKFHSGTTTFRSEQIVFPDFQCQPGDQARVFSPDGAFLARGYFNPLSRIPLRILSYEDIDLNPDFWADRIAQAHRFRLKFYSETDSFRVIYAESDGIPGLVVDKFGAYLVIQITTAGIERFKPMILDALVGHFKPAAVVSACDSQSRKKEGLPLYRQVEYGTLEAPVLVPVGAVEHFIDPLHGHKTGFFLDQQRNREKAAQFCAGKRVLDMFSYSGAFSIQAARAGAAEVTGVDIFAPGIELATRTAQHLHLSETCRFLRAEAFAFLKEHAGKQAWDVIFLDPPSLVRGSHRARRNRNNYLKLNRLALGCLAPGGILVTSICSFHVSRDDFMQLMGTALFQSGRSGKIFFIGGAGPDHPVSPGIPGTDYLKCFFIQLLN